MLYSDSLREMMQNGIDESFWDGLGVEIGPCAIFKDFPEFQKNMENLESWKKSHNRKIIWNWMLWEGGPRPRGHRLGGGTLQNGGTPPTNLAFRGDFPENRFCHFFAVPTKFVRSGKMLENRACPNLDAMSVPEALV